MHCFARRTKGAGGKQRQVGAVAESGRTARWRPAETGATYYLVDTISTLADTRRVVEIVVTDEFKDWYEALSIDEQEPVFRVVTLLEELGTKLGYPYSSAIRGSAYPLRELRVQHRGRPYRVFYAFDPERQAVLLLGGDKSGKDRFYEEYVPKTEALWERYLLDRTAHNTEE
jgi:hypothetical protein